MSNSSEGIRGNKIKLSQLLNRKAALETEARRINNHYSDEPTTDEWQQIVGRIAAIDAEIAGMNLPSLIPHNPALWDNEE